MTPACFRLLLLLLLCLFSGKSTMVGVLTRSMLDDGRGLARGKVRGGSSTTVAALRLAMCVLTSCPRCLALSVFLLSSNADVLGALFNCGVACHGVAARLACLRAQRQVSEHAPTANTTWYIMSVARGSVLPPVCAAVVLRCSSTTTRSPPAAPAP